MTKFDVFLSLAMKLKRELDILPLLYGSLGLEQRLKMDLQAEDIDILIPQKWLREDWQHLVT